MRRPGVTNRQLVLLLAAIVLVSALALLLGGRLQPTGRVAEIVLDGEVIARIDLDAVREAYPYPVHTPWGENILLIEPDGVRVQSADCPDKLCVKRGKISDGLLPLVCLPHRLTVRIVGGEPAEIDAVSGR